MLRFLPIFSMMLMFLSPGYGIHFSYKPDIQNLKKINFAEKFLGFRLHLSDKHGMLILFVPVVCS